MYESHAFVIHTIYTHSQLHVHDYCHLICIMATINVCTGYMCFGEVLHSFKGGGGYIIVYIGCRPQIYIQCASICTNSILQFLVCHVTQSSQSEEEFVLVGVTLTLEDCPSLP